MVCGGTQLLGDLCAGWISLLDQVCLCVSRGRCTSASRFTVGNLPVSTKDWNLPLTAEINQRPRLVGSSCMNIFIDTVLYVHHKFIKGLLVVFARSVDLSSISQKRNSTLYFIDGALWEETNMLLWEISSHAGMYTVFTIQPTKANLIINQHMCIYNNHSAKTHLLHNS